MSSTQERNIVLLSHNKIIEYDNNNVFIDTNPVEDLKGKTVKDFAYEEARKYYSQFFSTHFENLNILTGAGSSVDIGKNGDKGKTREELWTSVKNGVTEAKLKELCKKIKYEYPETGYGDIEAIFAKHSFILPPDPAAFQEGACGVSRRKSAAFFNSKPCHPEIHRVYLR